MKNNYIFALFYKTFIKCIFNLKHLVHKAGHTSMSGCQCAIGFRGYVSISFQWSRPRLSASLPTLHTPITSLCPTLEDRKNSTHRDSKMF